MTQLRKEAIQILKTVPEEKLEYVIQIMKNVDGNLSPDDLKKKKIIGLEQFVMPATERGQRADDYVRELRENDRM